MQVDDDESDDNHDEDHDEKQEVPRIGDDKEDENHEDNGMIRTVRDDEFGRCVAPLVYHFFPDGPPLASIVPPSSVVWPSPPSTLLSRRRSRRGSVVSAQDAQRSLTQTISLCGSQPVRKCLTGAQASTVLWIACEMIKVLLVAPRSSSSQESTLAHIQSSSVATSDHVTSLVQSIRISPGHELHNSVILRMLSLLHPSHSHPSLQSTVLQFLYLLLAQTHRHVTTLPVKIVIPSLVNVCVHSDTDRRVVIDAARLLLYLWTNQTNTNTTRASGSSCATNRQRVPHPCPRSLAQRLRQRLQQLVLTTRKTSAATTTTTTTTTATPFTANGKAPSSNRTICRSNTSLAIQALCALLHQYARLNPDCHDLVLPFPILDNLANGVDNHDDETNWRLFPDPYWESQFLKGYDEKAPLNGSTLISGNISSPRNGQRPYKRQRSEPPLGRWVPRLRGGSSLLLFENNNTRTRRGSSSHRRSTTDVLKNRDWHHRILLSHKRLTNGGIDRQVTHHQEEEDELARLDTLLPFLLNEYITTMNSSIRSTMGTTPATAGRTDRTGGDKSTVMNGESSPSYYADMMKALLSSLHSFALHTQQLVPAMQTFVETILLPDWDGTGWILPSIVSYWTSCPFEELYHRVLSRYVEPLLLHGDTALQYRIVTTMLAPLVEHWIRRLVILKESDRLINVDEDPSPHPASDRMQIDNDEPLSPPSNLNPTHLQALHKLIRWIDTMLVKLCVLSNDVHDPETTNEDLLHLLILQFYSTVAQAQHSHPALCLGTLPPPPLVYRLFLSSSPFIVDRLCHLLFLYEPLFRNLGTRTMASTVNGVNHNSGDFRSVTTEERSRIYNSYVWDTYNTLWLCTSLPHPDESESPSRSLVFNFVATRETQIQLHHLATVTSTATNGETDPDSRFDMASALGLVHGATFAGFAREFAHHSFVETMDDDQEGNENGELCLIQGDVKVRYLDYLHKRGFKGIHAFLSSHMGSSGRNSEANSASRDD